MQSGNYFTVKQQPLQICRNKFMQNLDLTINLQERKKGNYNKFIKSLEWDQY